MFSVRRARGKTPADSPRFSSPQFRYIAAALHDFLALHDIPNRSGIGLVIVAPDRRTEEYVRAAMRKEVDPRLAVQGRDMFPRADLVLHGVAISVRSPKQVIEV